MNFDPLFNAGPVWLQDTFWLISILGCGLNVLCAYERYRALRQGNQTLATRVSKRKAKLNAIRHSHAQQQSCSTRTM